MTDTPSTIALAAAITALACAACQDDAEVATVEVCGDVMVPQEVDTIRISVLNDQRQIRQEGIVELLECPSDRVHMLPQRVEVRPVPGNAWITVAALKDGAPVGRFERRIVFSEESFALMGITRDCLGLTCALGQTCVDGRCVIAPAETGTSICRGGAVEDPADAGVDADEDAADEDTAGMDEGDADLADAEPDAPEGPIFCPPGQPGAPTE